MKELEKLLRANILVEPYNDETDYNILTSVVKDYCDQFSLRFLSFVRENYDLHDSPFGSFWLTVDGEKISDEELLNKFLDNYGK